MSQVFAATETTLTLQKPTFAAGKSVLVAATKAALCSDKILPLQLSIVVATASNRTDWALTLEAECAEMQSSRGSRVPIFDVSECNTKTSPPWYGYENRDFWRQLRDVADEKSSN